MKKFTGNAQASFDSVAHSWAWKHHDNAQSYNGDMYHYGNSIYSYGSHFEMARKAEIKGTQYVFWNPSSYSPTTTKHQNAVRSAIPGGWTQLDLPHFPSERAAFWKDENHIHLKNVRHHLAEAQMYTKKQKRARTYDYTHDINYAMNQAKAIYKLFKPKKLTKIELEILADLNNTTEVEGFDLMAKAQERQRKLQATKKDKAQRKRAEENLIKWRAGANVSIGYHFGYLLRVSESGENIETSAHAYVPVKEAKLLWKLVQATKAGSENWKKNGKTFEIGHYSVDLIQAETGDIVVGCHHILYTEMKQLADSLGWS